MTVLEDRDDVISAISVLHQVGHVTPFADVRLRAFGAVDDAVRLALSSDWNDDELQRLAASINEDDLVLVVEPCLHGRRISEELGRRKRQRVQHGPDGW